MDFGLLLRSDKMTNCTKSRGDSAPYFITSLRPTPEPWASAVCRQNK